MGKAPDLIPVLQPSVGDAEHNATRPAYRSRWLGLGPETAKFEQAFAAYLGANFAVSVNSGTSALLLAMKVAGVKEGTWVIMPSLNFVAAAQAAIQLGAKPLWCDVDKLTLTIDPQAIADKIHGGVSAVVVQHHAGIACDMTAIRRVVPTGIAIIEDAAHGLTGEYAGIKLGTLGDYAAFSFHAVKPITTGEGGMVICRNQEEDARLRRLRWFGISQGTHERTKGGYSWDYDIEELGYKAHLNDVASLVGLKQLQRIEELAESRRQIAKRYFTELGGLEWLEMPHPRRGCKPAWHLFIVRCDDRDGLHEHLKAAGIGTGVHYKPLHLFSCFASYPKNYLEVTEAEWPRLLSLPIPHDLTEEQQSRVISAVKSWR